MDGNSRWASVADEIAFDMGRATARPVELRPAPKARKATLVVPPAGSFDSLNKLHELLGYALGTFETVLADKRYIIDQSVTYFEPEAGSNSKFRVSVAGSVLATATPEMLGQINRKGFKDRILVVSDLTRCEFADAWGRLFPRRKKAWFEDALLEGLESQWNDEAYEFEYGAYSSELTRREARRLQTLLGLMHRDLKDANL